MGVQPHKELQDIAGILKGFVEKFQDLLLKKTPFLNFFINLSIY